MLYRNHCKLRRQYRFPISERSPAYLKSEREIMKTCVLISTCFVLLFWAREKNSALVRVREALNLVQKEKDSCKYYNQ